MAEDKPKQVFCQNEHGKFENKTSSLEQDVDIEELRRENQLLKEKLNAIQKDAEVKPPKATATTSGARAKTLSASSDDLATSAEKPRGRSPSRSNSCSRNQRPDKYWQWYNGAPGAPGDLPCQYNPHCYSNGYGNGYEDEYLADMLYRYPDYFGQRNPQWSARSRAKSYDDINRILEVNALYDNNYPRRWRPRTRSMEGHVIPPGPTVPVVGPTPLGPSVWDPYFSTWKYSGGPRIPFRPRSVWDLCVGMKVSMHRSDGRLSRGTIRWIGLLPNLVGEYVGVELETQTGRHDGYLNGVRYFKCKEKCGIFVKFSKVIMAWR